MIGSKYASAYNVRGDAYKLYYKGGPLGVIGSKYASAYNVRGALINYNIRGDP